MKGGKLVHTDFDENSAVECVDPPVAGRTRGIRSLVQKQATAADSVQAKHMVSTLAEIQLKS
jgi:hypothetical protein